MGLNTLIDILGSTIIGGILMLTLFRMQDRAIESTYDKNGELIAQTSLVSLVEVLERDFRKIGFCTDWKKIPVPSKSIITADSSSISFLTDTDEDGNVDTLHYYLGGTAELSSTPHPNDQVLYRVVNSDPPKGSNLGVTQFDLIYFNVLGDTIAPPVINPGEIFIMQINITVENVYSYGGNYSSVFWRQMRLSARNLRNR